MSPNPFASVSYDIDYPAFDAVIYHDIRNKFPSTLDSKMTDYKI